MKVLNYMRVYTIKDKDNVSCNQRKIISNSKQEKRVGLFESITLKGSKNNQRLNIDVGSIVDK